MYVGDQVDARRKSAEPDPTAPSGPATKPTTHRGYRGDIDGMRAIAVALVVVYHAGWGLFGGGFVGVDVFFVLSGFLITGLLAEELQRSGSLSFARFYGRRIRRLLPMSALVLVCTAVAFSFVISPLDHAALEGDIRAAVFYVANWHFAGQAVNYQTDPSNSPVLHFWSLGVEEQFYVVWPLLLVLVAGRAARRHNPEGARRRMFAALAVVAAASFALSVIETGRSATAYYGLHTRAWELAAGGLLALGAPWLKRVPRPALALGGWIGIGAVFTASIVMGANTPFPGSAAAIPVLGTVLMLAAGGIAAAPAGLSRLLSASWLRYVGRVSYGWYLWHWPCIVFVRVLAGESITANNQGAAEVHVWPVWTALAVLVSFGLACVSHHVLENPVRRSRWLAATRGRSLALGAALMVTVIGATTLILPAAASTGRPVVTALVAGHGTTPVSKRVRLNLSPAAARLDRPKGLHGCYASNGPAVAPSNCVFGDRHATRTIALVGDSHAEMWFPALKRASIANHWRLVSWSKSSCPFLNVGVHISTGGPVYGACASWNASVLAHLRAQPTLDAIIVAHSGGYLPLLNNPDGSVVSSSDAPQVWGNAWASTEATLKPLTSHIVVMRDAPHPATDVPACLASHGSDVRPCSFPRSGAFTDSDIFLAAEKANSDQSVNFIDLDDLLCPGDPCPVVANDGTIMYADTHHVTASFSREVGLALGARLRPIL